MTLDCYAIATDSVMSAVLLGMERGVEAYSWPGAASGS